MAHSHAHHGHHHHHHAPQHYHRAFAIGVVLNIGFVVVELIYGWLASSMALIADAGHNFSDVITLLLAWGASLMASRKPSGRYTYGFRRLTIMASLVSATLLIFALGIIAVEAFQRFATPHPVDSMLMIVVALIGVVINTATALLFMSGQKHDLNLRGAFLHMAADAAVSLGVVLAGIAIMFTGWLWLDPAISLAIVAIILIGAWQLFRDSMKLSADAVPAGIRLQEVEAYLLEQEDVTGLHDLHIWALSTTETALTVHLVTCRGRMDNHELEALAHQLHDRFDIGHATIQVEQEAEESRCRLDRPHCI
jgi:cobalt-zinc-cadmium efflux system protein